MKNVERKFKDWCRNTKKQYDIKKEKIERVKFLKKVVEDLKITEHQLIWESTVFKKTVCLINDEIKKLGGENFTDEKELKQYVMRVRMYEFEKLI